MVRLICRNTIEEQIHALGTTKLALDDRVAGVAAEEGGSDFKVEKQAKEMAAAMIFDKMKEEFEEKPAMEEECQGLKD